MQYTTASLIAAFAVTSILSSPVPLNINMGAYSPALVVGDGAIGFKGTQSVAQIMSTLQGTAAGTAAANGAAAAVPAAPATASPSAAPKAAEAPVAAAANIPEGMGKQIQVVSRDSELSEREIMDLLNEKEKRTDDDGVFDIDAEEEAAEDTVASAKRDANKVREERQTAGFMAALNFATAALKTTPEVQLGTGEGGSGVGITVNPKAAAGTVKVGRK